MANNEKKEKLTFFGKIANFFKGIGKYFKEVWAEVKQLTFFGKIANFFKGIGKYFKEVWAEVKQLTWPTPKELVNYCIAVIAFCALMAIIIGLLDLAFGSAFQALANLGK